jgi:hypothetical protein
VIDTDVMPPDFTPGLLTRLRVWRAHGRLHHIIRGKLLHHGEVGETADCAHCDRRWILRQTEYATCLREVRR